MGTAFESDALRFALIIASCAFFLTALFYYLLTIFKRSRQIKEDELREKHQEIIDRILFTLLFTEITPKQAAEQFRDEVVNDRLFSKLMIKTIISLHKNYSGIYKCKLEDYYEESGFARYSLRKLKSERWHQIVEGIRDLSNLNYNRAYHTIAGLLAHPNEIVQREAFIRIVRLKGPGELVQRKDHRIYLDDWTQSNILYNLKSNLVACPDDIDVLLTSSNPTMILLGMRIIDYYHLSQFADAISNASGKIPARHSEECNSIVERLKLKSA